MHSLEKINEYGMGLGAAGIFYDFTEPSEFTRDEMTNIWLVKHANGDLIFDEEYRNLPDFRSLKTTHASQAAHNESKNRFLDIKAYDDSRVVLLSSASAPNAPGRGNDVQHTKKANAYTKNITK